MAVSCPQWMGHVFKLQNILQFQVRHVFTRRTGEIGCRRGGTGPGAHEYQ